MKQTAWLSLILTAGLLPGAASAQTEIYTWLDGNGNPVFSQEGGSIPFDRDVNVIILPDPARAQVEAEPVARVEAEPVADVVVPMRSEFALPTIDAQVNDLEGVEFVVDTGASITVLNRELADALDIDLTESTRTRTLKTAQGTITATQVELESLRIGDAFVEDLTAVVVEGETVPNLLGRNFLNNFSVTLDPTEDVLILRSTDEYQ